MKGLMMDYPLTLTHFFERSRRLFAKKSLATRIPGAPLFRYTYADFAERTSRLAGALRKQGPGVQAGPGQAGPAGQRFDGVGDGLGAGQVGEGGHEDVLGQAAGAVGAPGQDRRRLPRLDVLDGFRHRA